MRHSRQRGSALLPTVIAVVTVTVIGIGIVRFAAREVAGATAGEQQLALAACADAAKQHLLSQFHALGVAPPSIQAFNVPLDGGMTRAVSGHIGGVQVTQVVAVPRKTMGSVTHVADVTNALRGILGGQPYMVTVHCQMTLTPNDPASGRQVEVELGLNYGP